MIKNDRQYRITKAQIRIFEEGIRKLRSSNVPSDVDPRLLDVQRQALESQHAEMTADIQTYEALRDGNVASFTLKSIADLPKVLIEARIAAGLTQKGLAVRLSLKEQQVQRWEATDYSGASLSTLKSVMEALGVKVEDDLLLVNSSLTPKAFVENLVSAGISRDFLLKRMLPTGVASALENPAASKSGLPEVLFAAGALSRILGVQAGSLLALRPFTLPFQTLAAARFKLPKTARFSTINVYTLYAHYLAALVESCVPQDRTPGTFPKSCHAMHRRLTQPHSPATFRKLVSLLWDCGVIVVPLRDAGGFHGAVWQIRNRFVIVLKQNTLLESRWLFDLLHETAHINSGHVSDDVSVIEAQPIAPDVHDNQEEMANEWAEDVIFDGKSDEIEQACVKATAGQLQKLKAIVPEVARIHNVHPGALANHMAYRLAMEGHDWWGAANNLQVDSQDPFAVAREELLQRISLTHLNWIDEDIIMRALKEG